MTAMAGLAVSAADGFVAAQRPAFESALAQAVSDLGPGLEGVERVAADAVGLCGRGGRRWRPLLALAAAEAVGVDVACAMPVAVAVELTHTASLVLDDLPCMDDSALRRGRAATHQLAGTAGAILVAVGLLGRAAELVGRAPRAGASIATRWGQTIGFAGMTGGQAIDVAYAGRARGHARRVHRRKTTALSQFALEAAALSAGASEPVATMLGRYGRDIGWAYQLADDAADADEDGLVGHAAGGRSPRRQAACLLRQAERGLDRTGGVSHQGRLLLTTLGRAIVPLGEPRPEWAH
jgi:geranylgeranyl diphosphate synthase type II